MKQVRETCGLKTFNKKFVIIIQNNSCLVNACVYVIREEWAFVACFCCSYSCYFLKKKRERGMLLGRRAKMLMPFQTRIKLWLSGFYFDITEYSLNCCAVMPK